MHQLLIVPADRAASSEGDSLVVHVTTDEDLTYLKELEPDSVAWVEVPLELAHREELNAFSVDVVLTEPEEQAGKLYELARIREPLRPRITLPLLPGFATAAKVAMSLHFPLRILPRRPGETDVRELAEVLRRYLQDPAATEAVEPFHSALSVLLHGNETTLWDAVDENPAWIRNSSGESLPVSVEEHLNRLIEQERPCASCSVQNWCAGWFKWPDPDYDCENVRQLFLDLEETALKLRSDLDEAMEAIP